VCVWLIIALSAALLAAPFFPPSSDAVQEVPFWYGTYAVVGIAILVFALLYWYVWIVLVPGWRGKRYEERMQELDDGTVVTRLVLVPRGRRVTG